MRRPSKPLGLALAALLLGALPAAAGGDAAAGRKRAAACQACHGLDGLSKLPEAPNLAGQVEVYLVKALREYRDGTRRNAVMTVVAKDLTDAEIDDLAAYYGGLQIEVLPPG